MAVGSAELGSIEPKAYMMSWVVSLLDCETRLVSVSFSVNQKEVRTGTVKARTGFVDEIFSQS